MTYPIIIPMPIGNSGSGAEYIFPTWVTWLMFVSLIGILFGLAGLLIATALDFGFDIDADALFRFSLIVMVAGTILMLIALPCMLLTGTTVE